MKILSVAGDRVVVLLDGDDTQGQYTVMEAMLPPGAGPPPHVHRREDETFAVLAGEVTFHIGDQTVVLRKGEFIFAPREIPHYFKNTGSQDAVLLETASPAGVERFFEAVAKPLATRQDRPQALTPEDISQMRALAPKFGITILGPK
jgi:mannose-6-phosphate isomerase-like protein (cupin superfamily)